MMPVMVEIESAMDTGQGLKEIYARLRSQDGFSERTLLLRRADELAGTLGSCLRRIADLSSQETSGGQTQGALRALGEMIERVMVEEREYRIASGAWSEADVEHDVNEEVV